jgi:hypothetical protein
LHQARDLAALLEARGQQRRVDQVGEQGVRRDDQVSAGGEHVQRGLRETLEKSAEPPAIRGGQHREARQWAAHVAVERRRDAPDAAVPAPELLLLGGFVFAQSVRGVGDDGFDGARTALGHDRDAVAVNELVPRHASPRARGARIVNRRANRRPGEPRPPIPRVLRQ